MQYQNYVRNLINDRTIRTLNYARDNNTGVSNEQNCTLLQHNNNNYLSVYNLGTSVGEIVSDQKSLTTFFSTGILQIAPSRCF